MRARIVLFCAFYFCVAVSAVTGQVVTKVACTEYQAAWLYSDGNARSFIFNNSTGHVEFTAFVIGGRKAVDISTGFNRITILDDQGYVWLNNGGASSATRWNTDATGAAFNGNVSIYGYFYTYLSIRTDGSIWYWGGDDYKFYGGVAVNTPTKLNQPAGVKFVKLATGNSLLGLTSTGDVYEWDKGSTKFTKVSLPRPASDIAASHMAFNVAVVPDNIATSTMGYPYAWGSESPYWGGDGTSYPLTKTQALKTMWKMAAPIKKITANQNVIHYIDANGDLYGIGDNPNGEVGNGQELVNHADKYPTPYAWSWSKYEMLTGAPPIHIVPGTKFKDIFTGNTFAFYHYALDVNDGLYFWGRNKSFVGGDGAVNNQEAIYPNALDVLTPTKRNPLGVAPTQTAGYDFKKYTLTTAASQTISGSTATLSATATPSTLTSAGRPNYGYSITKYQWTKVSGPASGTITSPNASATTVTGLVTGTYVFSIQTTDNNTGTIAATTTLIVNSGGVIQPGPPGASAGADQTITLPASSVTVTGTGLESNGTITGYQWTQVSGPNTAVFANAKVAQTAVSGLAAGTYIFKLTVTDKAGLTASDQVNINVNPAVSTPTTFTVSAGPDQSITLPAKSLKVKGVATVKGGEAVATCRWTQVSGPSTASIANGGSIAPTVDALVQGAYVFQVAITSKSGKSSSDQMKVTVNAAPTVAFTVSAGPDIFINLPTNSCKIPGVATVKGISVASCRWFQVSGPSAAGISGGGSITPKVSKLVAGTYTFEVDITSASGVVAKDQMNVNVNVTKTAGADLSTGENSSLNLGDSADAVGRTVKMYPNPVLADQQFAVEGQGWKAGTLKFTIYDIRGRVVKQVVSENQDAYFRQTITVAGLVRGVYMLAVQADGEKPKVFKFLIQ